MNASAAKPSPEPSEAARAFGQRLKDLRLGLRTEQGTPPTQEQMAELVLVGNKGVVSMFETGRRLPTLATLGLYATACGCGGEELVAHRSRVLAAALPDPAVPEARATKPGGTRLSWLRGRVWWVAAGVGVAGAAALGLSLVASPPPPSQVRLTTPHGVTDLMTSVRGTVSGHEHDDLWLDVQAIDGDRHHTTEEPCPRDGGTFTFGTLYVGQPNSHGLVFRISVIATPKGSRADRRLTAYGERPKNVKSAYLGLLALPPGAQVVASIEVKRR